MHAVGRIEQQAELGRDGHGIADEMAERGRISAVRVHALRHLRQLVGVAKQDDRCRRAADGDDVGQRHLPSLVDEEDVDRIEHVVAGEEPRRAGGDVVPTGPHVGTDRPGVGRQFHRIEQVCVVAGLAALDGPKRSSGLAGGVIDGPQHVG